MNVKELTALSCERLRPIAHVGLRVAAGVAFFSHGSQKLFGWFGGVDGAGGAADLISRFGAAGMIETVAGCLIVLGLAGGLRCRTGQPRQVLVGPERI